MSEEILNSNGKEGLIATLNKTGYMLEEKAYKLLKDFGAVQNIVFNNPDDDRIEIDLIHSKDGVFFIIECKRTEYDWIFTHGLDNKKNVEMIKIENGKLSMFRYISGDYKITKHQIGLKVKDDGSIEKTNNKDVMQSKENFNNGVYQLLNNIDVFLEKSNVVNKKYIIPIIVTNAGLFFVEYKENQINNKGNLEDCKFFSEQSLIFNFPFIMKWQKNGLNEISGGIGFPSIKSIFVVNISALKDFIINFDTPSVY